MSYPSKRQASTTLLRILCFRHQGVVIPIQTTGFYNFEELSYDENGNRCHTHPNDRILQLHKNDSKPRYDLSCHTHPNDRLLQLVTANTKSVGLSVVIPIQTTGFYNKPRDIGNPKHHSCHTHPNDRLLQRPRAPLMSFVAKVVYPSKRQASTTTVRDASFLSQVQLSYPSKRQASTTEVQSEMEYVKKSCHTHPNDRLLQPHRGDR